MGAGGNKEGGIRRPHCDVCSVIRRAGPESLKAILARRFRVESESAVRE